MQEITDFLLRHGYALLFGLVFAEQIGLPVPAVPGLLAMGALAGAERFSLPIALATAALAAFASDLLWYVLGRRKGQGILTLLCRVALEPDACVVRTKSVFGRYGARALLVAKFFPGFSTAAPPLAGMTRMPLARFAFFDGLGTLLWAGLFLTLGYVFSSELERIVASARSLGAWLAVFAAVAAVAYGVWLVRQRRRLLDQWRQARITPEELWLRLQAGEPITVVDLRRESEWLASRHGIPGARRYTWEALQERHQELPRDRDVVLYCT